MKYLFSLFLFLTLTFYKSTSTFAQLKIGADVNLGLPHNGLDTYYNNGFGGDVYVKFLFLRRHLSLGVKAGYVKFQNKENQQHPNQGTIAFLPVKGNAEFYLLTKFIKPFVGVDFGVYNVKYQEKSPGGGYTVYPETYYGFAPLMGLGFGLLNHFDLNFTARFEQVYGPANTHPQLDYLNQVSYIDFLIGASFTF